MLCLQKKTLRGFASGQSNFCGAFLSSWGETKMQFLAFRSKESIAMRQLVLIKEIAAAQAEVRVEAWSKAQDQLGA